MSLAKLFYLKEAFRARVRRWRQASFRNQFQVRREQPFVLETLEPRLLLSVFYDLEVVAETGGAIPEIAGKTVSDFREVSINNQGQISVNAMFNDGSGAVLADLTPAIPEALQLIGPDPSFHLIRFPQINDSGQIVINERYSSGGGPFLSGVTSIVETVNTATDSRTPAHLIVGNTSSFGNNRLLVLPTINNDGAVSYVDANSKRLISDDPFVFGGSLTGAGQRPMAGDGAVVVVDGISEKDATLKVFAGLFSDVVASTSVIQVGGGLTGAIMWEIGFSPGISDDGKVIAFVGKEFSDADPAIFLSYKDTFGWTTPVKIAGKRLIPGATSFDKDGDKDVNAVPELGYMADGKTPIYMASFDMFSRIAVIHEALGPEGIEGDSVVVSYIGTPSSASRLNPSEQLSGPARPLLFTGEKGLWTQRIDFESNLIPSPGVNIHPTSPIPVVQIGDTITASGSTFTVGGVAVYDQLSRAATMDTVTGKTRIERYGDHHLAFVVIDQNNPGTQRVIRATHLDSDEDGLLDHWETKGMDLYGNGSIDLDLPAMGADPNKRDIFLEIDWLVDRTIGGGGIVPWSNEPAAGAIDFLVSMFANAPGLSNGIGPGITLHVDAGDGKDTLKKNFSINMPADLLQGGDEVTMGSGQRPDVVYFGPSQWAADSTKFQVPGVATVAMRDLKDKYFSTTDRGARELAFHYAILADFYDFYRLNNNSPPFAIQAGVVNQLSAAQASAILTGSAPMDVTIISSSIPLPNKLLRDSRGNPILDVSGNVISVTDKFGNIKSDLIGKALMITDGQGKQQVRRIIDSYSSLTPATQVGLIGKVPGLVISNNNFIVLEQFAAAPADTSDIVNVSKFVVLSGSSGRAEIAAHPLPDKSNSINSIPGNDLLVTFGAWGLHAVNSGVLGNKDQVGRTLAHELGHNFGLMHGGTVSDADTSNNQYRSLLSYDYLFAPFGDPAFAPPPVPVNSFSGTSDLIFDDWAHLKLGFQAAFTRIGNTDARLSANGLASEDELDTHLSRAQIEERFGPIDFAGPNLTIDNPSPDSVITVSSTISVHMSATDIAGVDQVVVLFDVDGDGATSGNEERVLATIEGGGQYAATFQNVTGSQGQRSLDIAAVDTHGNITWRSVSIVIIEEPSAQPPTITARLNGDTGASLIDRITSNFGITGGLYDSSGVAGFRAGFDATLIGNFVDVLSTRQSDGTFTFTPAQLTLINGGPLSDGVHTLHLQATDGLGNVSPVYDFTFTLDTAPPAVLTADLLAAMDTAPVGDLQTTFSLVTLVGQTEPNAVVSLLPTGATATADGAGAYRFTNVALTLGTNQLTVRATDAAGNSRENTRTITRVLPPETQAPTIVASFVDGTGRFLPTDPPVGIPDEVTTGPNLLNQLPPGISFFGVRARLDGSENFTDVSGDLQVDGSYRITRARIEQLSGGPLADGSHTLHIEAIDPATAKVYLLQDIVFPIRAQKSPLWVTNNPTITGSATDNSGVFGLRAGLDEAASANYVDLTGDLQPDGSFSLTLARLEQINGGPLLDGPHTLHVQALDVFGTLSPVQDLVFILDRTATAPTVDLSPASDRGISPDDNVTVSGIPLVCNVTVPESNGQVRYTVTGPSAIGPISIAPQGAATTVPITLTGLTAGGYTLSVQFVDVAGNISPTAALPFVIVDPPKLSAQLAHDTGGFIDNVSQLPVGGNNDRITSDPTISGLVTVQSNLVLFRAGFGATAVENFVDLLAELQPDGSFTLNPIRLAQINGAPLADGAHVLRFHAIDSNGMTVAPASVAFILDTTPPAPPVLDLVDASDTGASNTDNVTSDTTPEVAFSIPEGFAFLEMYANTGRFVANGYVGTSGGVIPGFPQPDGVYAITATFQDVAGNTSQLSAPLVITIDTGGVPLTFDLAPSSDTSVIGDQQTSAPVVTLIGQTSPNATVALLTTGATTTADSTGAFAFSDVALTLGSNLLEVGAEDEAGNIRQVSKTIERVELEPGDPPFLTARLRNDSHILLDTGEVFPIGADKDGLTSDLTVVGRVFTAGTITSFSAGFTDTPTFNILSDLQPNGEFSLSKARLQEINGAPLLDGAYLLRLNVVAEDGTESLATVQFVLDATAPTSPVLELNEASDSGASNTDHVTNVTMPVLNLRLPGIANEASRFLLSANGELVDNDLFEVQLVPEGNDVTGRLAFLVPVPDGIYQLRSTLDDVAGNMSTPSSLLTIIIDTTVALSFDLDPLSDTSTVGDQTTTFSPVTLTGHTDPGAEVTLLDTGATTTADDAGRFSFAEVPLALGVNLLTVQAVDRAGNVQELARTFTRVSGFTANQAPVLASIGPQVATESQALSFTVNAVDPDGDVLVFVATGLPPGATFDPTTRLFSWTPTEAQGLETFGGITFAVSDGRGASDSETLSISVAEANQAPVLAPIGNKTVDEGSLLQFTISASDADFPANTLTYSAANLPAGAVFDPATRMFSWTPTEAQGPGMFLGVTFSVSDGMSTTSETIKITVGEVNQQPVLFSIGNQIVNKGTTLTFVVGGTDLDSPTQPLTFSASGMPTGAVFDSATRTFSWTPAEAQGPGVFENIRFSVSDGVTTTSETISITAMEVSQTPFVGTIGNQVVNEGERLTFTVNAADASPSDSFLVFSASNLPTGAVFDSETQTFTWTPTESQGQGLFEGVVLSIHYGQGGTEFEEVSLTVNEVNQAPVFTSTPVTTAVEGQTYLYEANAADADIPVQTLMFSLLESPEGMTINLTTGRISWTPNAAQAGSQLVIVGVTDGGIDAPVTQAFTIQVEPRINAEPVLGGIGDRTVNEGETLTFTLDATDEDLPANTLTFGASNLPSGAMFDANTRIFSWIPTEAQGPGVFTGITFSVSDGQGGTDSETIQVTVNEVNQAPVLGAIGNKSVQVGTTLSFAVTAADVDRPKDNLTFSLGEGAPAGATINARTGEFQWMPSAQQGLGVHEVTVNVTDGKATDSETFTITVTERIIKETLVIKGTTSCDVIKVCEADGGVLNVSINGERTAYKLASGTKLEVYGLDGNDAIILKNLNRDATVYGGNGNDFISARGVTNGKVHLYGQNGCDVLIGGHGDGLLDGGNGKDLLVGGGGKDELKGENGKDWLFGGKGDDVLFGGNGKDLLIGGGLNQLKGDNRKDWLFGGKGDDALFGGNARDLLIEGDGDDFLNRGRGKDVTSQDRSYWDQRKTTLEKRDWVKEFLDCRLS